MIGLFRYSKKGLLIRAETRKLEAGDNRYLKGSMIVPYPVKRTVLPLFPLQKAGDFKSRITGVKVEQK